MHLLLICGTGEKKKKLNVCFRNGALQAANSSHSPLVRHSDWHNQVTTKLKGRGHQQELASLCCTNDQLCQRDPLSDTAEGIQSTRGYEPSVWDPT